MMLKNLTNKKIILASKSTRRQELLKELGLSFEIKTKEIKEDFPNTIDNSDVASFLAKKKAESFELSNDEIIITSDTTVLLTDKILINLKIVKRLLECYRRFQAKHMWYAQGFASSHLKKKLLSLTSLQLPSNYFHWMKLNIILNASNPMIKQAHTVFKNGSDLSGLKRLKDVTIMLWAYRFPSCIKNY